MAPKFTLARRLPMRPRKANQVDKDSPYVPRHTPKSKTTALPYRVTKTKSTTTKIKVPTKANANAFTNNKTNTDDHATVTVSLTITAEIQALLRQAQVVTENFPRPHAVLDKLHREIAYMAGVWDDMLEHGEEVEGEEIYKKIGEWMGLLEPFVGRVRKGLGLEC